MLLIFVGQSGDGMILSTFCDNIVPSGTVS